MPTLPNTKTIKYLPSLSKEKAMNETNYRSGIDRRSGAYGHSGDYRCFGNIPVSERILNTVFLLTVGIAYLVALANMCYAYQGRDGKAGMSIDDDHDQFSWLARTDSVGFCD
jgi:hypothetical protein